MPNGQEDIKMMILASTVTAKHGSGDTAVPYSGTVTIRDDQHIKGREFSFQVVASYEFETVDGESRKVLVFNSVTVTTNEEVFLRMECSPNLPAGLDSAKRLVCEVLLQAIGEGIEAIGKGRMYLEKVLWGFVCEESSASHSATQSFRTASNPEAGGLIQKAIYS